MAADQTPALRPLRLRMAAAARAVGKPQYVLEKDDALTRWPFVVDQPTIPTSVSLVRSGATVHKAQHSVLTKRDRQTILRPSVARRDGPATRETGDTAPGAGVPRHLSPAGAAGMDSPVYTLTTGWAGFPTSHDTIFIVPFEYRVHRHDAAGGTAADGYPPGDGTETYTP